MTKSCCRQYKKSVTRCGMYRMDNQMESMTKMLEDPFMKEMMINMMRGMDSETLAKMTGMPPEQVLSLICVPALSKLICGLGFRFTVYLLIFTLFPFRF